MIQFTGRFFCHYFLNETQKVWEVNIREESQTFPHLVGSVISKLFMREELYIQNANDNLQIKVDREI